MSDAVVDDPDFKGRVDEGPSIWQRLTSWTSFFDLGHGATGYIPDTATDYTNVQEQMRAASQIQSADDANHALDQMEDQLNSAVDAADSDVAAKAASTVELAHSAITVARYAYDFPNAGWMSDAAAKTATAINMLKAGALQLSFAKNQLARDVKHDAEELGLDIWEIVGYALVGGVLLLVIIWSIKR